MIGVLAYTLNPVLGAGCESAADTVRDVELKIIVAVGGGAVPLPLVGAEPPLPPPQPVTRISEAAPPRIWLVLEIAGILLLTLPSKSRTIAGASQTALRGASDYYKRASLPQYVRFSLDSGPTRYRIYFPTVRLTTVDVYGRQPFLVSLSL